MSGRGKLYLSNGVCHQGNEVLAVEQHSGIITKSQNIVGHL